MAIQEIILGRAEKYQNEGFTPEEVNGGLCEEFAAEVIDDLGGYRDGLTEIWTENFLTTGGEYRLNGLEPEFDWHLLQRHWNIPRPPDYWFYDRVGNCNHCFIILGEKFHDAECPDGVSNFFELPFFQRALEEERRKG